jgi:hypothetical protein
MTRKTHAMPNWDGMRKIIVTTALVTVGLSGCATFGQLEEGLDGLIGQNIQAAISVLGFPSGEREIAGIRVVEWGRSNNATFSMPTSSTTTGYLQSGTKMATYAATTNSSVPVVMNFNCNIALQVDSSNVIRRYQYEGNLGGCEPYIKALNKKKSAIAKQIPLPAPVPVRTPRHMQEEI